jgi:site-specific recombinase XerD
VVYLEIEKLFDAFLKEKQFLCGASPATVRIYSKSWAAYQRYVGCTCEITGDKVKSFTLHATQEIKPGSVNAYARSVNSFLTWLFEKGHVATRKRWHTSFAAMLTTSGTRSLKKNSLPTQRIALNQWPLTPGKGRILMRAMVRHK